MPDLGPLKHRLHSHSQLASTSSLKKSFTVSTLIIKRIGIPSEKHLNILNCTKKKKIITQITTRLSLQIRMLNSKKEFFFCSKHCYTSTHTHAQTGRSSGGRPSELLLLPPAFLPHSWSLISCRPAPTAAVWDQEKDIL